MKKTLPLIFLIFLVLLMIVVWSNAFKKKPKRSIASGKAKSSQSVSKEDADIVFWGERSVKKRLKSEFKSLGRDPFSLGKEAASLADLNLIGILWDESFPQAIINGEIVKVGDVINNNKVVEIKRDKVILSEGKNRVELKLWNEPDPGS